MYFQDRHMVNYNTILALWLLLLLLKFPASTQHSAGNFSHARNVYKTSNGPTENKSGCYKQKKTPWLKFSNCVHGQTPD